jgi:hypothetical protein
MSSVKVDERLMKENGAGNQIIAEITSSLQAQQPPVRQFRPEWRQNHTIFKETTQPGADKS